MEGVGPPPWTPLLGLGFEMPSSKGVGEGTMALSGSPLPTVLVFQDQPRVGSAPWMGLGPSRRPALGCAATKLNFLAGFICSKRQIPPWEPRWLGTPCQIAQEFTTRRQTESSRGIPLPSPQKEQEEEPLSLCLGLAGGQGDTSGTPFHTRLAHPALSWSCQAAGRQDEPQKSGALCKLPTSSCDGVMEGSLYRASKQGQSLKQAVP